MTQYQAAKGRGLHSRKPVEVRRIIEAAFPGARRLELIARGGHAGRGTPRGDQAGASAPDATLAAALTRTDAMYAVDDERLAAIQDYFQAEIAAAEVPSIAAWRCCAQPELPGWRWHRWSDAQRRRCSQRRTAQTAALLMKFKDQQRPGAPFCPQSQPLNSLLTAARSLARLLLEVCDLMPLPLRQSALLNDVLAQDTRSPRLLRVPGRQHQATIVATHSVPQAYVHSEQASGAVVSTHGAQTQPSRLCSADRKQHATRAPGRLPDQLTGVRVATSADCCPDTPSRHGAQP